MDELWRLSAAQLAQGYGSGAFTPVHALDAVLARIERWQPHANAMALVDAAGARQAAGASRLRWARHQPRSPLDGVPVTLKDNLNAGGLRTGWGSRLLDGFVARKDELPVARLRAAGAVVVGKTCLPEFAMQGTTSNRATGVTRNPWNLALTPGGSSGGAAAAVATRCSHPLPTQRACPRSRCRVALSTGCPPASNWPAARARTPPLALVGHYEQAHPWADAWPQLTARRK